MGKVIFEFDEIDDRDAIEIHMTATKVRAAIDEYADYLRTRLKYEELSPEVYDALEAAQSRLHQELHDAYLS